MKGQVSLEALIVLAALLAALAVWLGAVNGANSAIASLMGAHQARLAAGKLAAGINAVCVMGYGNVIELEVYLPGNATFSHDGENLSLPWGNVTFTERVHCPFDEFSVTGRRALTIKNTGNGVEIS